MRSSTPPKIAAIQVVATRPTEGDSKTIELLNAQASKSLPQVTYIVKIRLASVPPASGQGIDELSLRHVDFQFLNVACIAKESAYA